MINAEKKKALLELLKTNTGLVKSYYFTLEQIGDLKTNYIDYMTTAPIDVNTELKRLVGANYDLCTALLTMLLREDHFSNGEFEIRYEQGQVTPIIKKCLNYSKNLLF